ncbi:homocysteine S-methyltransferase family protein [Vibrio sinaloensis]|uniref:homocysteine S-methyltransferase family protein n=1 Tax=Photobacterium sp. (strain ATCC 43367) TaxID=379097 RepID=UPI0035EAC94A
MKKLTTLDGGMGRELKRVGAPFSQPLWSAQALIESPQHVADVHQSFIDAGAEIIITNAYACVPFHLGEQLYQSQGHQLAETAAQIARTTAELGSTPTLVAGCIPPAMGSYRPDLFDVEQSTPILQTLIAAQEPYIDVWMVETLASIEEFEVNHRLLSHSQKPVYYAFTLDDEPEGNALLRSGETVTQTAKRVATLGASGMLFNCSIPEVLEQAIVDAKKVFDDRNIDIELGAYANNFEVIDTSHQANDELQAMRSLTTDEYLQFAKRWYDAGATIIGGCCGIGPEYIKTLAEWKAALAD